MGIFSRLFGSAKIIDAGIDGIDAMVFTDEEKSNAKMAFLKLYEPYKLAQRYLAMVFCPIYALAWLMTFITELAAAWFLREVDLNKVYSLLHGDFATMVLLILGFYFGGGAIEGVVNKLKKV